MKPRQLVHRGTVHAAAFWVDESIVGPAIARRRILELPGVEEVRRMDGGLFVRLRAPLPIATDHAIGIPLVVCQGIFVGAPLNPDELDTLSAPSESVVLVRGGECVLVTPTACPLEDLATWIDLAEWHAEDVKPLGILWTSPQAAPAAKEVDPRQIAGIGPLSKEAEAFAQALGTGRQTESTAKPKGFAASVLGSLSAFLSAMAARLGRKPQRVLNSSSQSQALVAQSAPSSAPRENWSDRLRMALNTAAAKLLVWARLASWIGQRQADYLEKTLSMFDSGDLDEALRHAIPLGTGSDKPKPLALNVPSPRTDLSIHTSKTEASSTLGFGGDVFEALRRRYRKAVEQLEKQGKIKEAAFVLAELLGASEEAVSFLEKHHEYQLAAELAEGRYLDPALVVRQWIIAGNRDRAVLIARRTGAFATAVARLEQSHPQQAAILRILWANQLAASGAYGAAVQTIWPVEAARHLAHDWIDRGIAIGGTVGAKLLATKAWLLPETFASVIEIVRVLPRDESDLSIETWTALGQSILANPSSKTMRILARASVRALMSNAHDRNAKSLLDRLTTTTEDPVLIADIRRQQSSTTPTAKVRISIAARSDTGLARTINEDGYWTALVEAASCTTYAIAIDERALPALGAIFGVADGTGGFQAAEVVNLAFHTMAMYVRTADKRPENIGTSLMRAVEEASVAVFKKAAQDRKYAGSGATITVGWVFGDVLWVAHVGDTRAYLFRDGKLNLITKDHSLINELLDAGKLTPEEFESFAHKNVITRALGTVERVKVDLYRVGLLDGDRILLSSDGVHGVIDHEQMVEALRRPLDATRSRPEFTPKAAGDILKKKVFDAGAPDNLALVVADVDIRNAATVVSREAKVTLIDTEEEVKPVSEARVITRTADDIGTMAVHDAVVLPDGRLLVALGEAGVRMLSREGKTIVQFDQPAHRIVISDHGDRAIVLTLRGESYRTARIDLVKRRAERWFDANLQDFANSFDGSNWFVFTKDGAFAIDALENNFSSIWDLKEPNCFMGTRSPDVLSLCVGPEIWLLDMPAFRVRMRRPLPPKEDSSWSNLNAAGNGTLVAWVKNESTQTDAPAMRDVNATTWTFLAEGVADSAFPAVVVDPTGTYGVFGRFDNRCTTKVFDLREKKLRFECELHGATHVQARFQAGNLILADDRGRVLVVNLERNKIVGEWRI